MIDIEIAGLALPDCNMDILLDARAILESEILSRAAEELAQIEKRKATLEQLLAPSDRVLDAPAVITVKRNRREPVNPPKFYNPENPDQTWTGRGPMPKWFKEGNPVGIPPADPIPCCNGGCIDTDSLALAL